jgi:NAD(P)-dependent dehydrogenase (short-subunit alcohol dehydrogenase family)
VPPTAFRFRDRTILVTGAGSGIGRAAARRMAEEGGRMVCADIDAAAAEQTAATIRDDGGDASAAHCDVSDPGSVAATVAQTLARNGRLHALINVAGTGHFQRTHEETLEGWNRVLAVNLTGTFLMCREALPHLLETKGVIVNTASVAGLKSHPYSAAYCASKGGVVMLTRALAVEYARRGVRVNCVCPGRVETPLLSRFELPAGASPAAFARLMPVRERSGSPEEVAGVIAFLASDDASYMIGDAVVVDGGMTA